MKKKKTKWIRHYRDDKGTWEYICPHGVGHEYILHGCDGCCRDKDFPGRKEDHV